MSNEYEEFMESNKDKGKSDYDKFSDWVNKYKPIKNKSAGDNQPPEKEILNVQVVDVDITFWSMTILMVKGTFAFILACILLFFIGIGIAFFLTLFGLAVF